MKRTFIFNNMKNLKTILVIAVAVLGMCSCKKDNNPYKEITVVRLTAATGDNIWVSIDGSQQDLKRGDYIDFNPYKHNKLHVVCTMCSYDINGVAYYNTQSFDMAQFRTR